MSEGGEELDFCYYVPNDRFCTGIDPNEIEPVDLEPQEDLPTPEEILFEHRIKLYLLEANMIYLVVPTFLGLFAEYHHRTKTSINYYGIGEWAMSPSSTTRLQNYWKNLNNWSDYFIMGFVSLIVFTQALATYGIYSDVNYLVWKYGTLLGFVFIDGM